MEKEKLDFIKANGKAVKLLVGEVVKLETDTAHFYWLDGEYQPSTTHIIDRGGPIEEGLRRFWKENTAEEGETKFKTAGDFGTKIHDAAEKMLAGLELNLLIDYPTEKEKKAVMSFIDWFNTVKPKEFESEQIISSKKYRYAGTLDFVGLIGKKRWLIDFKTSSGIFYGHQLQVLAYKQAYEESFGKKIDRIGVLRLGSAHKGNGNTKYFEEVPLSGKGWEFKPVTDLKIEAFTQVYKTYLNMNGGKIEEPKEIEVYPEKVKLFEEAEITPVEPVKKSKKKIKTKKARAKKAIEKDGLHTVYKGRVVAK